MKSENFPAWQSEHGTSFDPARPGTQPEQFELADLLIASGQLRHLDWPGSGLKVIGSHAAQSSSPSCLAAAAAPSRK
jgi:hypothetical protein